MTLLLLAIIAGGGYVGWTERDKITSLVEATGLLGTATASFSAAPELFRVAPFAVAGDTPERIDAGLQRTALWSLSEARVS